MDITAEMLSRLTKNIDKTIKKGVGLEFTRIDPGKRRFESIDYTIN